MTIPARSFLTAAILVLAPSVAEAHLGHIGEVAGHSHWLGLGALAAAAAALALLPKKKKDEAGETPQEEASGEPAGEEEAV